MRLLTYGVEDADPDPPSGTSGGLQVVETDPNSGAKHYEVDAGDSTEEPHRALWSTASETLPAGVNNRDYFVRQYFKKSEDPSSAVTLLGYGNYAEGFFGEVILQTDGTLLLRRNGSFEVGTSSAVPNGYFYVELRLRHGTESGNGQIEARLQGEQFAIDNTANLGEGLTHDELRTGVINSSGGTGGVTIRSDDLAFNDDQGEEDSSWPGALEANEAPVVATGKVTDIGGAIATLDGTVNPKGLPTDWWFEVLSGESWVKVPESGGDAGDGEEAVPVKEERTGLDPETKYTIRLAAENEIGKSTGEAVEFETGPGPSETPVSNTFEADHEGAELLEEYGDSSTSEGTGTLTRQTPGYDGGNALKAAITEPDGYARGHAQKAETGWKSGEEVRWGGVFYLPAGFYAAKQGQIDIFRWDNFEQDEEETERSGLVFFGGDKKLRLVVIKENSGAFENEEGPTDQATLVDTGQEPAEGKGHWVEVRQVLWHEDGLAVNEVWLNGVKVGESTDRNCVRSDLEVSRYRVGIAASNGDQTNDLSVYVDRIRSGPMPLIGALEVAEPPVATTGAASNITPTKATLNGTVDPNLAATTYYFEYGETEAYGTKIPASEDGDAGEGSEAVAVDEAISGLKPNTTYHFRLVAVNAEGESVGEDAMFTAPVATSTRVVSEPVDDTLFIELRHGGGSATRLGPDEYEAAGIPQAIDTADGAPGGHRTASFNLVRDPRRDWPDLHLVDDVVIYGRTRPLGRSAFEGQLAHFPSELGDGMSIGVNAVGHQVLLSEDESWRALYVALGFDGWGEAPFVRRERIAEDLGWPQGKISLATDSGGLVWDVPDGQALSANEVTEAHFQLPAGVKAARLGYRGTRRGSWASMEEAKLRKDDAEDHSGAEEVSLTLDGTARTTSEFTPRRYLALRARVTSENTPGPGRQQAYDRLAVYGDNEIPLREIEDELPGVYAHDVLSHMLDTGAPGLNYRVGAGGTIVPNTNFVLPDLAFPDTGKVADAVPKLNAYFLNNYAVWDRKEFHWHPWDPNRLTWRATIAGGAHWSPAGRQAETQLNGMVVSFDDHAGRPRLAGPPGSGCDVESELLLDTDRSNPYTRRGRRRWGVLRVDFPLAFGSTAVQIGHVKLLEQKIPQRSGTLVIRPLGEGHVPQLEHPTMGPLPTHAARSGDYVELDGWPEPEPFRIIEKPSYQHESKSLTLQLETASSRMSAIMERVGVSLKGVIGR